MRNRLGASNQIVTLLWKVLTLICILSILHSKFKAGFLSPKLDASQSQCAAQSSVIDRTLRVSDDCVCNAGLVVQEGSCKVGSAVQVNGSWPPTLKQSGGDTLILYASRDILNRSSAFGSDIIVENTTITVGGGSCVPPIVRVDDFMLLCVTPPFIVDASQTDVKINITRNGLSSQFNKAVMLDLTLDTVGPLYVPSSGGTTLTLQGQLGGADLECIFNGDIQLRSDLSPQGSGPRTCVVPSIPFA
jgi:hypothetical protein